ncbi:MAG: redox-regulated ATPase YchF [Gemmatimonadota bacterium]|nr:redox-regulated ATPase YchF [Gemmatimonadota bacterium]
MKIGLIGYPLSGKTSVFNTLTGLHARVDSFHSSGKEANVGTIKVPDQRLERLEEIYRSGKVVHAEINFVDIAGIMTTGGSFEAKTLSLMRMVDALTYVIRDFRDETVSHPRDRIDPVRDIEGLDDELKLADLIVVENRQTRIAKEGKKGSPEYALLERCRVALEEGTPLKDIQLAAEELKTLTGFDFLSLKPRLILLNTDELNMRGDPAVAERFEDVVSFCAKVESEIAELDSPEEQQEFLEAMEISEPAREKFIHASYRLLNLISFLTIGKDEVRAWTITRGTDALRAAGKVHSDIERGFIRAETVAYDDFIAEPSMVRMKELGKVRLEGKTYVVADGDMIDFRFNV